MDELHHHHLAKVRVAGSNPVFRSRNGAVQLGWCESAGWFSSLFLPTLPISCPSRDKA